MTSPKVLLARTLNLTADPQFLRRIWAYTCATQSEVSAIAEIEETEEQIYLPDLIHLLPQEGSPVHTALDMEAVAQLVTTQVKEGKSPARFKLWFHSHVDMEAYFSYIDTGTIESLAKLMPTVVAVVTNRRGETQWRLVHNGLLCEWKYQIPGKKPTGEELIQAETEVKRVLKPCLSLWERLRGKDYVKDYGSSSWDKDRTEEPVGRRQKYIKVTLVEVGHTDEKLKLKAGTKVYSIIHAFKLNGDVWVNNIPIKDVDLCLLDGDLIRVFPKGDVYE